MSDWQQTGADLRSEWLRRHAFAKRSYVRHRERVKAEAPMLNAVIERNRGDKGAIQRLLRSADYLPSPDDLETLAHYLDGGFTYPEKLGAPKGDDRWVASQAKAFLEEWKQLNRSIGVSDWGKRGGMTQAAIDFIIEAFLPAGREVDPANVAEIMRRGKSRQN